MTIDDSSSLFENGVRPWTFKVVIRLKETGCANVKALTPGPDPKVQSRRLEREGWRQA